MSRVVLEFIVDGASAAIREIDRVANSAATHLKTNFDAAGASLSEFGSKSTALGQSLLPLTGIVAGLGVAGVAAFRSFADNADGIAKAARAAGLAATPYQELKYAIGQIADVSDEEFVKGLGKVSVAIADAAAGNEKAVATFTALGYSQAEIASGSITTEDAFMRLNTAMQTASSESAAMALAGDLLGDRLGPKLAGALRDSGDQVEGLRARAHDLGAVLGTDALAGAETFNDSVSDLMAQLAGLANILMADLMPHFQSLVTWLSTTGVPFLQAHLIPAIKGVFDWFANLPGPVQGVIAAAVALAGALGPVLIAVGAVSSAIGAALPVLGTVGAALLTFASGPIGIVVAAVAGLTAVWTIWGDDIKRIVGAALGWVGDQFSAFVSTVSGLWRGIVDVISGAVSDMRTAFRTIPTALTPLLGPIGLVLATFRHWNEITRIAEAVYTGVKTWLIDRFTSVVDGVKAKVDAVTGFFGNMYNAVVGNSFVPDMVEGIKAQFARLGDVMVSPARETTSTAEGLFSGLMSNVSQLFSGGVGAWKSILDGGLSQMLASILSAQGPFAQAFQSLFPSTVSVGGVPIPNPVAMIGQAWLDSALGPHFISPEAQAQIDAQKFIDDMAYLGMGVQQGLDAGYGAGMNQDALQILLDMLANGQIQGFKTGGWGQFGAGTPATLHGHEAIFPLPDGFDLASSLQALESVPAAGSGGRFKIYLDGRELIRSMVRRLPDEADRLGAFAR